MSNYTVQWSINLEANSPQHAAELALERMLDPVAPVLKCEVYDTRAGLRQDVDLAKLQQ